MRGQKMRLWIMSDLHLDVNAAYPFQLPTPWPAHDAVILAGDVCEGIDRGVAWIEAVGLNERPVVYVPGNHEFYGRDRGASLLAGQNAAAKRRNVHVLDRQRLDLGAVTVLGATLWTDYALYGTPQASMQVAERYLSDHRMIGEGASGAGFSAAHASAEHDRSVDWLARAIAACREAGRLVVVVSHHAPSPNSVSPRFQGHPLTAAFASNLERLFPGVALWVHGHTHRVADHTVGATRIINNPRGYLRHETTGFTADLVVDVG
jgi:predicted phosphodiesterase